MHNKIVASKALRFSRNDMRTAGVFLLPALLVAVLFVLVPVLGTFWNSLFRDVSYLPRTFIGFKEYADLFTREDFLRALRFTLAFTVVAVFFEAVLGIGFALLLNELFPGRGVLRTIILIPWAIPTIVSAKVWKLIFDYSYGVLNYLVVTTGISDGRINWLGTPLAAFWSLIIAEVWKTTPFMVILVLAGLQAVSPDIYKQARIDGASLWRRFVSITLPLIRPVVVIALVFRTIDSLRVFDLTYVLTGGGPGGTTKTLSMLGFEYYANDAFGTGSAISVATFLIVLVITLVYIRVGKIGEAVR